MPGTGAILGALALLLDAVAIFRAVSRDHGVERTLAWIFAILALPWLGALAYLALASPSVGSTTRRKAVRAAAVRRLLAHVAKERGPLEPDAEALLTLAARTTGLAPTDGNEVRLLARDSSAFERIEEALASARESIWAEYYLVRNDATGRRFLELLAERARAGIDVRFVYDAVGSMRIDAGRLAAIRAAGGRTETFLPLNPLRRRWSVHLRNHRKLVIVDGEVAFTGGMNVGDEYSGRARRGGLQHFDDSHLEVAGPLVRSLAQVFAEDWAFATDETLAVPAAPEPRGSAVAAALPSGPDQRHNATELAYFTAVAGARRRVLLTSPYFIPDEALQRALVVAALRGVDVRILAPERSDVRLAGAAARSYFRPLLAAGVRVFLYRPAMLHAKTLLVDRDLCMVGSANADIRSFRLNFELGTLVCDGGLAGELERVFEADVARSEEQTLDSLRNRGVLPRLGDSLARLLSPLL